MIPSRDRLERDRLRGIIQAAMDQRDWSQSDLARAAELPRYTVSRILRGETSLTAAVGRKIAQALDLQDRRLAADLERRSDEAPSGFWSNRRPDGSSDVQFSGNVPRGVSLALEALINHQKPLSTEKLATIIAAIAG